MRARDVEDHKTKDPGSGKVKNGNQHLRRLSCDFHTYPNVRREKKVGKGRNSTDKTKTASPQQLWVSLLSSQVMAFPS